MNMSNDTITDLIDKIHHRLTAKISLCSYDRELLYEAERVLAALNNQNTKRLTIIRDLIENKSGIREWIRDNLEITAELSDSGGPGNCVDIGLKFKGEDRRFTSEHVYIPSDFPDDNF